MPPDWFAQPVLTGPTLVLRPLTEEDAADYAGALAGSADEVFAHLRQHPPQDAHQAAVQIAQAVAEPDRQPYAQRLRTDGTFVGTTSFYEINPELRAIAIGHTWLARSFWRTAVNTESKLIMLTRAFETLGAERVVWHTDVLNLRSQAAIERLGAEREGVLRHHRIRRDGSWRDTVQFSMLAAEWPAVRARLTKRLAMAGAQAEDRSST